MENSELLKRYLADYGVALGEKQIDLMLAYKDLVLEKNKCFNLTAITDERDFLIKHVLDSLLGAKLIAGGASVLDVGSGAGFPCVMLAIACENASFIALDSTAKKINFINESCKSLGIKNVKGISGRAEEKSELFSSFDIVTARAVASLPILLELAIPMLKVGGKFIAYKTDDGELGIVKNALKELSAELKTAEKFELPDGEKRALLVFEKVGETSKKYPRLFGAIKKKPL